MADTIRQKIISAVDARLKTILIAGGYETNLGSNVFEWKDTPFEGTALPAVNYRDKSEVRSEGAGVHDCELTIEMELFAKATTDIRKALGDIEKSIFTDERWGGFAHGTSLNNDEMMIVHKENIFSAINLSIVIFYRTAIGDPYTQA